MFFHPVHLFASASLEKHPATSFDKNKKFPGAAFFQKGGIF